MIRFECAGCGAKFKLKPELAGKKVKCPKCGKVGVVPAADELGEELLAPPMARAAKAAAAPKTTTTSGGTKVKPAPKLAVKAAAAPAKAAKKAAVAARVRPPADEEPPESSEQNGEDQTQEEESAPAGTKAQKPQGKKIGLPVIAGAVALVGLGLCWAPVPMAGMAGVGLVAIGLLMALGSLVVSIMKKGAGIGPAIAAVAVAGAAGAVVWFVDNGASELLHGPKVKMPIVDPRVFQQPAEEEKPTEPAPKPKAEEPAPAPPAESKEETAKTVEEEGPFTDASQPAKLGDVEVKILSAKVGKVATKSVIGDDGSSEKPLLAITVELTNTSDSKKIDYESLGGSAGITGVDAAALQEAFNEKAGVNKIAGKLAKAFAALKDNNGNVYKRTTFELGVTPKGRTDAASIYPGKSVQDVLVFEQPVENIEYLTLTLPGTSFGAKDVVRFRIPKGMLQL